MTSSDPLIGSLESAVRAAPTDVPLRVHLASLLQQEGDVEGAVRHAAAALHAAPADPRAREVMAGLLREEHETQRPAPGARAHPALATTGRPVGITSLLRPAGSERPAGVTADPGAAAPPQDRARSGPDPLAGLEPPDRATAPPAPPSTPPSTAPFVPLAASAPAAEATTIDAAPAAAGPAGEVAPTVRAETVTLADVGGMTSAKERLEATVLAPLRNPSLRRLYGRGLTGGVLLYGPPGSGKTYLASAVAGELGVPFVPVHLADREGTRPGLQHVFAEARAAEPVVICLEDVDALGKGGRTGHDAEVRTVDRLVGELDGPDQARVFVVATTSAPWDVDPSLRRNGRLGRTMFVTPPDQQAREVILRRELVRLGETALDLHDVALLTEGFSGDDLTRLLDLARERRTRRAAGGGPLLVDDLKASLPHVAPSSDPWFDRARSEAQLEADESTYAGLREYLKARGRW